MMKKLRSFDLFGQPFAFNAYKDSGTFTTVLGGLITIIWIISISFVSFVIISSYMDTTKPVVSVNRIRLTKPIPIDLLENKVGLLMNVFDGKKVVSAEESKRFVTFAGRHIKTYKRGNETVEESVYKDSFPCSESNQLELKEIGLNQANQIESSINLTEVFYHSMICLRFIEGQERIEGDKSNLPFARNTVDIFPCSLPDQTQCASFQELYEMSIGFTMLIKVAKFRKKKDPLEPYVDVDIAFPIDPASKVNLAIFEKMNYVYDDDVGILGERLTHQFVDVDRVNVVTGSRLSRSVYCPKEKIERGECEAYIEVVERTSKEKIVIQRRYETPFEVISEIGGFNDLIILVLWLSYFFYNTYSYKN